MSIFENPPPEAMSDVDRDMAQRCRPSDVQIEVARAMLRADPEADVVLVGLAFPGKRHGVWHMGQPVEPVPGFWLAGTGYSDGDKLRDYALARNCAEVAALDYLDRFHEQRGGTPAYVAIDLEREATFEGFARER